MPKSEAKSRTRLASAGDEAFLGVLLKILADSGKNISDSFVQNCGTEDEGEEETYWEADAGRSVTIFVSNTSKTCKVTVIIGIAGGQHKDFTVKPGRSRSYSAASADSLSIQCIGRAGRQCSGTYRIIFP